MWYDLGIMVCLVGPVMSLSATGNFGKSLNFVQTPYGAVVRVKKRAFIAPGPKWYVNQAFFNAATLRWAGFSAVQQNAWAITFNKWCDTARDLFMGKQIAEWNKNPANDLTWPDTVVPDFPWPEGRSFTNDDVNTVSFYFKITGTDFHDWKVCGFRWLASESKTSLVNPVIMGDTKKERIVLPQSTMPTPYMWAAAWRTNGVLEAAKFCSWW
jgi:hypothetical protein